MRVLNDGSEMSEELFLLKIKELNLLKDKYNLIDIVSELSKRLNIDIPDNIEEICNELGISPTKSVLGNGLSKEDVDLYYQSLERDKKINKLGI